MCWSWGYNEMCTGAQRLQTLRQKYKSLTASHFHQLHHVANVYVTSKHYMTGSRNELQFIFPPVVTLVARVMFSFAQLIFWPLTAW